jgi:hypothetical protein
MPMIVGLFRLYIRSLLTLYRGSKTRWTHVCTDSGSSDMPMIVGLFMLYIRSLLTRLHVCTDSPSSGMPMIVGLSRLYIRSRLTLYRVVRRGGRMCVRTLDLQICQ